MKKIELNAQFNTHVKFKFSIFLKDLLRSATSIVLLLHLFESQYQVRIR